MTEYNYFHCQRHGCYYTDTCPCCDAYALYGRETPRLWQDASATFTPLEKVPANSTTLAIETPQKGLSKQSSAKPKRSKKAKPKEAPYMPVFNGIPSFSAIVAGQPLPKGRPRFNSQTKKTYTPETTAVYESLLIDAISKMVDAPFTGLLCVELEFCRATYVLADVDNLAKACLDAMNGILWSDDKQIRRLIADVSYGHEKPSVKIKAYEEWGE